MKPRGLVQAAVPALSTTFCGFFSEILLRGFFGTSHEIHAVMPVFWKSVKDNSKNLSVFQRWRFNYNMATFANLERGETAPSLALMDSESSVKVLKFVFSTCWGTLIIFINITSLQMAGSLIILNGSLRLILWAQKDYIVTFDWVLQLMLIQTPDEDDMEKKINKWWWRCW